MHTGSRAVVVSVLVAIAIVAAAGVGAAEMEEPLGDGELYWEGTIVYADDFAPGADEAALYTQDGQHVRNISLDGGDLTIDTGGLLGEYYVTAPGADRVSFEIVEQVIGVGVDVSRATDGPPYVTAEVTISTNRGSAVMQVTGFDDFTEYVEGDVETVDGETLEVEQRGTFTVTLDHLAGDTVTIRASDSETDTLGNEIFDVPPITHPPEADVVTAERGGKYWAGDILAFGSATTHEFYRIETVAGEGVAEQQTATDGRLYVNTSGYSAGAYRVLNESGGELTRFDVDVQELDATVDGETLRLESNRDGYNATITVSNESANVTGQVLADVDGETGSIGALGAEEELAVATERLAPGNYTIEIHTESGVNTSVTFSVAEETPTPTATATATPTATETTTGTPTATDGSPEPATTSQAETATSTPGFGVVATIVAIVALVAGVKASRE